MIKVLSLGLAGMTMFLLLSCATASVEEEAHSPKRDDPNLLLQQSYDAFEKTGSIRMWVYSDSRRLTNKFAGTDLYGPLIMSADLFSIQMLSLINPKGNLFALNIEIRTVTAYKAPVKAKVLIDAQIFDAPIGFVKKEHTNDGKKDFFYENYMIRIDEDILKLMKQAQIFQVKLYFEGGSGHIIEFDDNEINLLHHYTTYLEEKGILAQ